MIHISKLKTYLFLILALLSCSNLLAQLEKSTLTKIEELKSKSDFNPQNSNHIDLLLDLLKYNIHSDTTVIVANQAYELSVISEYRIGESSSLSVLGYYYSEKGELNKAYNYNIKALEVANKYNLNKEKIKALNNLGLDYSTQGDDANALTKFLEAIAVVKETEDTSLLAYLNNNIALLYDNNEDFDTALVFYELSTKYSKENGDNRILGCALLNMGGIYLKKKEIEKADQLLNRSIKILEEFKIIDWLSHAYAGKGEIALEENNYQEALKWYGKSEKLCDENQFVSGYTFTYNGFADSYLGLHDLKSAEEYALKALQVSKELSVSKGIKNSNLILSKIYFKKGEVDKAYTHQAEYIALYEEGSVEKFKKGLGVLRSKMKFENQKKLLVEENNKALAKQKMYIYLTLIALLIATLFLGLIVRNNKLQKKFTAQLSDSNTTKDKLFSVIAHDLRGPINSFYSLMKLYMDKEFSKEETEHLFPKAMDDIHNISDMLNNLLLWAKTQMQGTTIKQQNIDIHKIAHDNVLLLSPLADKKNIRIINSIPENTFSFSDKDHMDVILRNLISNAIKFTNNNGEININVTEINNALQIEVSDNGIGMDLETRSNLFKKNNTKSTFGTNNEKGTGLGLSLCKEMVESNGGQIWVSSMKDKGTTIFFTTPIKAAYLEAI